MSNIIRNIENIRGNKTWKSQTYGIIIVAADSITNMKTWGCKSLIKIRGIPLIDHQLNAINQIFKKKQIVIVGGLDSRKLMNHTKNYDVVRVENEKYDQTNISRSIEIGLRACNCKSVLVISGDVFFNREVIDIQYKNMSSLICCDTMQETGVGCTADKGLVENVFYDLQQKWTQIAYFTGDELSLLKRVVFNKDNDRLHGYEIINTIVNMEGKFQAVVSPPGGYAYGIDCAKDLVSIEESSKKHAAYFSPPVAIIN